MADGDAQRVAEMLSRTLELNADRRKAAEAELKQAEQIPRFAAHLVQLVCSEQMAPEIRMAAAVAAKNFVKRNWSDTPEMEVAPEQQEELRQTTLQAMFSTRGNLQNQLSHTVHLLAKRDFPEKWPSLVPQLAVHLQGDSLDKLIATLSAMDQLFKKFRHESKSQALWSELKMCLMEVQAPLTALFVKMIELSPTADQMGAEAANQLLEVLHLIVCVFHSLCSQDLPEFFEDNMSVWMGGCLQLLGLQVASQQSTGGEPCNIDKVKTEVCEVVTLYAQRYEEEVMAHMQQLIQAIWGLLVNTPADTRYDALVCAAIDFLTAICQRGQYESMFTTEGVLRTIAQDVAVKNLTLRQEDLEMFEDEPIEYMKKDIEGTDVGTRRRGAIDLVRGLCRRFEAQLVPILSEVVGSFLGEGGWMRRDVVYCLVTAMASRTETAKSGATSTSQLVNVCDFYGAHVRSDLCAEDVNADPILKADALKFVVLFRGQLPGEVLVEAVAAIERLLAAQLPVTHKYAAWALDRLMLVKQQGGTAPLFSSANVPVAALLARLVAAFDADPKAQNSAYLIKALLRLVNVIDPSTASQAGAIASRLAAMVEGVTKQPADPVHTHFLFETICVLIRKTSGHVSGGIDAQLLPLVETILSQDLADLIPYALQITGVLLSDAQLRGQSPAAYVAFLPFLLKPELWARSANVPAALSVIEVFLKVAPQEVLQAHGKDLMTHYARLIGSKALDQYGFQLANAILPGIEHVGGVDAPVSALLNNMFRRCQLSKTPKFNKLFVVFACRFAVVRGAEQLYKSMESIQPGMYRMVVEKLISNELDSVAKLTTVDEKRTMAIGLARILGETAPVLGDLFGVVATNAVKMVEAPSVSGSFGAAALSPEDEQASMYNAEGEFTNPYCKLSHAGKADVLAPEVTNAKKFLAQSVLQTAPASNPALLGCIPDDAKQVFAAYLQSA